MFERICDKANKNKRFVFFTGAGISTDSGIKDFRSVNGLYSEGLYGGYSPEEILSIEFLEKKPEKFFKFYRNKILNGDISPNDGHKVIAWMESIGFKTSVVTQNIDGLHAKAGTKSIVELHGSVLKNYCMDCKKGFGLSFIENSGESVPVCDSCGGVVRPDVVLYGECLDEGNIEKSVRLIRDADFLFAIGSSLTVYPAAGLLRYFGGDYFYIINIGETPYDKKADCVLEQNSSYALRELKQELAHAFR